MKVKVNDIDLELEPGTSAIDAVFSAGYDVPYFCSQEYMSPIGACRMCLAKVGAPRKDRETGDWVMDEDTGEPKIFWFPNPMATCTTSVMEGMVIDTLGPEAVKAQSGMMEMTLINHPLDCPTCDKGGACELQDRAYEYGSGETRFVFDKRHQEKHHDLSNLITLDRERCIHCKRCVRYFEEVPGDEVLDFIERGGHTFIGTVDDGLPSNFTGNITDICPVGALLDSTSRFRGRNWEYDHTRSTSLDDASGSAITIDARTGRIERIKAALNTKVNKTWIDDGTRFGHEYVDSDDRIETPLLRKDGKLEPTTWDEACAYIAEQLQDGGSETSIVLRADSTLEEGFGAKALAEHLGSSRLDHYPRFDAPVIPSNGATLEELATADAIFVIGDATEEVPIVDLRIKDALKGVTPPELMEHGIPIADLRLKERMPRKTEILTVAAPFHVDLMNSAGRAVTYKPGQEADLFAALNRAANGEKVTKKDASSLGIEDADSLVKSLQDAEKAVIVYGSFVLSTPGAAAAANAFAESVGAKVMVMGPMANSYGLESLSVLPGEADRGYASAAKGRALIVSGLNPAANAEAAKGLGNLKLLVVHDMFRNETTQIADVVLPAKSGYEKEGTVVNLEGRYLNVHSAPVDSGQSEDFTGVVKQLGEALGTRLEGRSVRSARRQLKKDLGTDFAELPAEGSILEIEKPSRDSDSSSAETEGNTLIVPSMLRAEFISRNAHLRAAHGEAPLRLHPADAASYNLNRDDKVSLNVGGVMRQLLVRPDNAVPEGVMLLPALPDQPVGLVETDMSSLAKNAQALEVA